jgi:ribonucleoside-diphosphate reductase alpha chain
LANGGKSLNLSDSALQILKKRYLRKDETGEVIETPEEMFWRVSKNIALMDVLYHPGVYKRNKSKKSGVETGTQQNLTVSGFQFEINEWDRATLKMAFERIVAEGLTKATWEEVQEIVEKNLDILRDTAEKFYSIMIQGKFLPNSPALINAGRELQQLSACFVLPVDDSMVSIFDSLKNAALIHQSGGGTGFSFSRLRPKNDVVRSTGGVASGPVSFMKVFNAATEAVKQGGVRRGANMGILRVDHPDILEFLTCKTESNELTNFNISVGITEGFMKAVEADEEYELLNPRNGQVSGKLNAREVFEKIVDQAWKNGEPGIIFLDRLNRDNPTPKIGEIESTNPCGEQPLLPYEACCLGSVNLGAFTRPVWGKSDIEGKTPEEFIDWDGLSYVVHSAVHFLDNLIDANKYPLSQIEQMVRGNRKIGLGIMGWADMLIDLGISYNSENALTLAEKVMGFIEKESMAASTELANARGVFPNYQDSIYAEKGIQMRNATTTTIAPTGTISIIGGASSGIEPLFSIAFTRHVLDKDALVEVNPRFEQVTRKLGLYTDDLMKRVARYGSVAHVEELPDTLRNVFVTSHQISPEWHIRMQAAFQKYTHNAVSKTVNFRNEATRDDVKEVFQLAYQLGCKGVTVYRDGSRDEQVLTVGTEKQSKAQDQKAIEDGHEKGGVNGVWGRIRPIERPVRLEGFTAVKDTPVGKLFLTLNTLDGHPVELFAQIGKAGSDVAAFTEAIARLVSIALRSGVDPQEVADQLVGIGGSRSIGFGPNRVRSVPDALGQFLDEYLNQDNSVQDERVEKTGPVQDQLPLAPGKRFSLCPQCGTWNLIHVEGCLKCLACGYSEC